MKIPCLLHDWSFFPTGRCAAKKAAACSGCLFLCLKRGFSPWAGYALAEVSTSRAQQTRRWVGLSTGVQVTMVSMWVSPSCSSVT